MTLTAFNISDLPPAASLLPYLQRMEACRWYSNFGPLNVELEEAVAQLYRKEDKSGDALPIQTVTLSNCTLALEIALRLMVKPTADGAKRVLMPAITFPACPQAVLAAGGEPVLADVDLQSWQLSPALAAAVHARTPLAAVVPVAIYGMPVPLAEWEAFCQKNNVALIIDAAAAFEIQAVPKTGAVVVSMHATKAFGAGEGGLLLTRDAELRDATRRMSNFGFVGRESQSYGTNAKLSEFHAAVALAQLARWPETKRKRRQLFEKLRSELPTIAQPHSALGKAVPASVLLALPDGLAPLLADYCARQKITTHRTYLPPLYRHLHFQHMQLANREGITITPHNSAEAAQHMPTCEKLLGSLLGVPFHPFLSASDLQTLGRALKDGLKTYGY